MQFTEKDILDALSTVEEPDLKKDLITLGMIRNIQIEAQKVSFTVMLTTPACPLKERIRQDCEAAIKKHISDNIEIQIDMLAEVTSNVRGESLLPNVKNTIAIASGKGGVGKSTVSANLALALAKTGASVGLIDADISGPSIPVMFGIEDEQPLAQEIDGRLMIVPITKFGVKIISMGLLAPADSAIVWRGPMASKAVRQFITDTLWGDLDYLLIDLPPGTGDIHLTMVQTIPLTGAVIVTTPQKVALTDARKGLAMFQQPLINVPILGIVENMSYFTPAELPNNKYYLFGQEGGSNLARSFEIPFLGEIPLVQSIREGGDKGIPAVAQSDPISIKAFEQLAQNLAQQIAIFNANDIKSERVQVSI